MQPFKKGENVSALALDEFTLEMRLHYITTTLESISRFKTKGDFFGEVNSVIDEWVSESRSNGMSFFANLLESLKDAIVRGALTEKEDSTKISKILSEYLNWLKTQEDSQIIYEKFQDLSHQNPAGNTLYYLQCVSHGHHFIISVKNVVEIICCKKIFPLPLAQRGICGLISFRGQGIPVINLNDFGFKPDDDSQNKKTCFVVCEYKKSFFSLEVDRTDDVLEIASSQFQSYSETSLLSPLVDRFVLRDDKLLMLLDIEKLAVYE
jgi:chemotaxis signal transduction protein